MSVGILVCLDALLNALCTPLERPTLTHVVYILLEHFLHPYRETGDDTAYTERHEKAEMELFMRRLDTLLDTILDNPAMWLKDDFEKLRKFSYTVGHDAEHFPPILPAAATQLGSQTKTNVIALTKDVAKQLYSRKPLPPLPIVLKVTAKSSTTEKTWSSPRWFFLYWAVTFS